jgi:hypothetical protein
MGMGAGFVAMQMQMRMWRMKHHKLIMDQHQMGRTNGIVLESVKIGQYISDLQNTIMAD